MEQVHIDRGETANPELHLTDWSIIYAMCYYRIHQFFNWNEWIFSDILQHIYDQIIRDVDFSYEN